MCIRDRIKSDFNEKFDEIKREMKKRNNNLNKQCDIVIKKLDGKLIQIEMCIRDSL